VRAPFTVEQFFHVMRDYNVTVWPMQVVLYAVALVAIVVAVRGTTPGAARAVSIILLLLWLWVGAVYHFMFFRTINPGATMFAALFVVQAALFGWFGVWRTQLTFCPRSDWRGVIGGLLVLYALVLYPLVGYAVGQRYPEMPTFGLPCPTTIFTIGLLFWAEPPMPKLLLVIPILWAALGAPAAFQFGVREDIGLIVAGLLAIVLLVHRTTQRAVNSV